MTIFYNGKPDDDGPGNDPAKPEHPDEALPPLPEEIDVPDFLPFSIPEPEKVPA